VTRGRWGRIAAVVVLWVGTCIPADAATWTRISQVLGGGSGQNISLLAHGASVLEAAARATGTNSMIEVTQFAPSLTAGALAVTHATLGPYGGPDDPLLLPGSPPGLFVSDGAIGASLWSLPAPPQPVNPNMFFTPFVGTITSAALDNGTLFFSRPPLTVYRGTSPPVANDLSAASPPGGLVGQRLGVDTAGRVWLSWYVIANSQANTGWYMIQIDPTTGAAIGAAMHAPQSSAVFDDNRFGFACAATCRLVYARTAADLTSTTGDVVSWAPGESSPTLVTHLGTSISAIVAAAYTTTGNLWVAWYTKAGKGSYQAKLGDARGAGGVVEDLATPPATGFLDGPSLQIAAVASQADLVVVANWNHNGSNDLWATTLAAPNTAGIPNPGVLQDPDATAVVPGTISKLPKGCVLVRVQAYIPATLSVEIRTGKSGAHGAVVGARVSAKFNGPGIRALCVKLAAEPRGFYVRKHAFHFLFTVHLPHRRKDTTHSRPVIIATH
jgi:hypothetical protein